MNKLDSQKLRRMIDHALLKSEATEEKIRAAARDTVANGFFGLAVNPVWNQVVAEELNDSPCALVAVAGFPLGATTTAQKAAEAQAGAAVGAAEVDMVANVGWLAANDFGKVEGEVSAIRASLPDSVSLKVIIETPALSDSQIGGAVEAVIAGGAQFVKTATGFFGGTTAAALALVVQANSDRILVKASGGIRTLAQAEEFVALGADRLGTSSGVAILAELARRETVTS